MSLLGAVVSNLGRSRPHPTPGGSSALNANLDKSDVSYHSPRAGRHRSNACPLPVPVPDRRTEKALYASYAQRTEITIETHRVLRIRRPKGPEVAWCASCGKQVSMITQDEVASVMGVDRRTISRWAEAGGLHIMELADGKVLICLNSLR